MKEVNDIEWFKAKFAPKLKGYELDYKFFSEGDFGSLNQVEFNSRKIGGNIDFWGLGWLGVFVWDYEKEEQLLNLLIEPSQEEQKIAAFNKLQGLL
ncbi:MAG TPA: hypothetical protein VFE53_20535 [Mucilaginibacter sp.]|jgi:hypothetical protein|nr:hypothetical protein [Mucilaginibacter sp.]